MEGSIYQRKDGRWVGVVDAGRGLDGKRKQKYVYGKTKKETTIKLNNLIYELQNDVYKDTGNVTLKGFFEEWYRQNTNTWEETTEALYRMYLDKHIYPLLGNLKLKEVLPLHINDYKNKMLERYSPNTVNKYLSFLSMGFKHAVENDLLLSNPIDNVKRLKKVKYKPVIYSEKQFNELLSYVEGTFDEIPILLAGACGLRRGEVFGLRWCDLNSEKCSLSIRETRVRFNKDLIKDPKNETSIREIAVPSFVFPVLERYKKNIRVMDINFDKTRVCERYKPQSYSEHFSSLLEKFGMTHIRFHDLRHYNAVIMMKYGVADKVAAERLGHSTTQTLRKVYQHVLTEIDEDAANKIEKAFLKNR